MKKLTARKGQRRKGPIRSATDRRAGETGPSKFERRGNERRQGDRRSNIERRALAIQPDGGQAPAAL